MDYAKVTKIIRNDLREYLTRSGLKSLVIGVSGGIDSGVCCALARPVCDELGVKLIGRSIPIESNKQDEIDRADAIGIAFCHDYEEIDLTQNYYNLSNMIVGCNDHMINETETELKIRKGNIKARMRMILLYDLAQTYKGMVLSTDNYTEYLLGFFTICGDVGDYCMIQYFWKTDVYGLANFISNNDDDFARLSIDKCIHATATGGLGVSNSDLDQLGAGSYDEVDRILKIRLVKDLDSFYYDEYYKFVDRPTNYAEFVNLRESLREHLVVLRYERTHFKRNNPYNIPARAFYGCY